MWIYFRILTQAIREIIFATTNIFRKARFFTAMITYMQWSHQRDAMPNNWGKSPHDEENQMSDWSFLWYSYKQNKIKDILPKGDTDEETLELVEVSQLTQDPRRQFPRWVSVRQLANLQIKSQKAKTRDDQLSLRCTPTYLVHSSVHLQAVLHFRPELRYQEKVDLVPDKQFRISWKKPDADFLG